MGDITFLKPFYLPTGVSRTFFFPLAWPCYLCDCLFFLQSNMIYSLRRIHPKKMQFPHLLSLCEKMLKQPKKRAAPRGSRVSFAAEIGKDVGGGGDGLRPHLTVPPAHTFTSVFRLPFPSGGRSSRRKLTSPSFCLSCTAAQCFSFGVNRFVLHDLSRATRELSARAVQPARGA